MNIKKVKCSLIGSLYPPKFLEMPSVGLDISDEMIRFVEIKKGKNGLFLGCHGEKKIPKGVVLSGKIEKPEVLKKILTSLREEYRLKFVRVSLPEERAYLAEIELPLMKKSEIRGSVGLQIEEYVPLKASESVFDYEIINKQGDFEKNIHIMLAVLPSKEVDTYLNLFNGTGLVPVSFEIEAQSIARAVVPKKSKGTYMVVDLGRARTGLSFVTDGVVKLTSTIEAGGDILTKAIEKEFNLGFEEAQELKDKKGFIGCEENKKMCDILISSVSTLRDEINRHYIYWHTRKNQIQKSEEKVQKIILCGGGAALKGFRDYLAVSMKTKVEIGNPWVNMNSFEEYIPEISRVDALGYTTAIGLALVNYK